MDYQKLLSKYIEHVGEMEGTDFIDQVGEGSVVFTEDEIKCLREGLYEKDSEET